MKHSAALTLRYIIPLWVIYIYIRSIYICNNNECNINIFNTGWMDGRTDGQTDLYVRHILCYTCVTPMPHRDIPCPHCNSCLPVLTMPIRPLLLTLALTLAKNRRRIELQSMQSPLRPGASHEQGVSSEDQALICGTSSSVGAATTSDVNDCQCCVTAALALVHCLALC